MIKFCKKIQILENSRFFFKSEEKNFFFVLKWKQKEHVHNFNRIGAKRPKSLVYNNSFNFDRIPRPSPQ